MAQERKIEDVMEKDEGKSAGGEGERKDGKNAEQEVSEEVEITGQTIIEHLEELRAKLIPPILIFIIVTLIGIPFSKFILGMFLYPFRDIVSNFIFIKPFESFWIHIKVVIYFAVLISAPIFLWQIWRFVSPALYPNERKLARIVVIGVLILFTGGAIFGYFVVLPVSLNFLIRNFSTDKIQAYLSIAEFISFAIKFAVGFGIAFQTPIVVIVLVKLGVIEKKSLSKFRPYVIVLAFVGAAIITPGPDALSQIILAIPLIVLWELGVLISKLI